MPTPLQVLLIEDRAGDAELMVAELRRACFAPVWQRVESEADYLARLELDPDVILADFSLPEFDAMRALALLRESGLDIPFIVVSGAISDEAAVEFMKQGADDYLLKDRLARLGSAVGRALGERKARDAKRKAEAALRASEERFRLLAEHSQDMIYRYHFLPERGFDYVSPSAMGMTGYSPEEFYADPELDFKLTHPDDRHAYELGLGSSGPDGPITLRWVRKDGSVIWTEQLPTLIRDDSGTLVAVQSIVRDITERKRTEDALVTFKLLFDHSRDSNLLVHRDGRLAEANSAASRAYGYNHDELLAMTIKELRAPEARPETARQMAEADSRGLLFETVHLRKDGSSFPVEVSSKGVTITGQRFLLSAIRDITQRRDAEEHIALSVRQLRTAMEGTIQAMATLTELRDPYTAGHQRRVSRLAAAMALRLGIPPEEAEGIRLAGMIHDVGKISVPAEILSKPGRLSEMEFSLIKVHASSGLEILSKIEFPWPIARMVGEHHERLDGSGYPNRVVGDQICLGSRILGVADVVEAMASHRPYRSALGMDAALEEISLHRGTLYEGDVVDACLAVCRQESFSLD